MQHAFASRQKSEPGAPGNARGAPQRIAAHHGMSNHRVLQRKCACRAPAQSVGECHECKAKRDGPRVQRKALAINKPGDAFEQEADRIAERVMRMAAPQPRRASVGGYSEQQNEQHSHAPVQAKHVQATDSTETAAPPVVHEVLNSPGQPLDADMRAFMEPRFGHDFSTVRVHTDARAAESARSINALAYTAGHDVVFGAGQYAKATSEGKRLLTHELTHVMQQSVTTCGPGTEESMPVHASEQFQSHESIRIEAAVAISRLQRQVHPTMLRVSDTYNCDILFLEGSSTFSESADSNNCLLGILTYLQNGADRKVVLYGYRTKADGGPEDLSLKRAETVKQWLEQPGVFAGQIAIKDMGIDNAVYLNPQDGRRVGAALGKHAEMSPQTVESPANIELTPRTIDFPPKKGDVLKKLLPHENEQTRKVEVPPKKIVPPKNTKMDVNQPFALPTYTAASDQYSGIGTTIKQRYESSGQKASPRGYVDYHKGAIWTPFLASGGFETFKFFNPQSWNELGTEVPSNPKVPAPNPHVTNDYSTFYVNDGIKPDNFVNLMLGRFITGIGPENFVFPKNGGVSNAMRGTPIVENVIRQWYRENYEAVLSGGSLHAVVGGEFGLSEQIDLVLEKWGVLNVPQFVGSATVTVTPQFKTVSNPNNVFSPAGSEELLITIKNVTSATSGDIKKHFPGFGTAPSFAKDTLDPGGQRFTNISQTFEFTVKLDRLTVKSLGDKKRSAEETK